MRDDEIGRRRDVADLASRRRAARAPSRAKCAWSMSGLVADHARRGPATSWMFAVDRALQLRAQQAQPIQHLGARRPGGTPRGSGARRAAEQHDASSDHHDRRDDRKAESPSAPLLDLLHHRRLVSAPRAAVDCMAADLNQPEIARRADAARRSTPTASIVYGTYWPPEHSGGPDPPRAGSGYCPVFTWVQSRVISRSVRRRR